MTLYGQGPRCQNVVSGAKHDGGKADCGRHSVRGSEAATLAPVEIFDPEDARVPASVEFCISYSGEHDNTYNCEGTVWEWKIGNTYLQLCERHHVTMHSGCSTDFCVVDDSENCLRRPFHKVGAINYSASAEEGWICVRCKKESPALEDFSLADCSAGDNTSDCDGGSTEIETIVKRAVVNEGMHVAAARSILGIDRDWIPTPQVLGDVPKMRSGPRRWTVVDRTDDGVREVGAFHVYQQAVDAAHYEVDPMIFVEYLPMNVNQLNEFAETVGLNVTIAYDGVQNYFTAAISENEAKVATAFGQTLSAVTQDAEKAIYSWIGRTDI